MPSRKRNQVSLAALQRELHRHQPGRKAEADAIIKKYARLRTNGKPIRCAVAQADVNDPLAAHSMNKVIFDNEFAARDCARELRVLYPTDKTMFVYPCSRSSHGHVHLTSKRRPDNMPEGI